MATTESPSAGMDTEELAQTFKTSAATDADTARDYLQNIDNMSSMLSQSNGPMREVGQMMQNNADEVRKALGGSIDVQMDATLEPGLNGFTHVGGTESDVTLNADLFTQIDTAQDAKQLAETADHELRHNEQVQLQTGGQETLLVTANGQDIKDDTLIYEADTETHTAETFGRRGDQPDLYAQAYDIGQEIQRDHGETWNETLTVTGDLATLQGQIWEAGLKDGSLTMDELIVQADQTGYTDQAADVLSRYVQQVP